MLASSTGQLFLRDEDALEADHQGYPHSPQPWRTPTSKAVCISLHFLVPVLEEMLFFFFLIACRFIKRD